MNNHSIKVSIIMPVHNAQKYITEAVKMIQAQTLQDWELIFVNDFSSDNTAEIVITNAEADTRIVFLENEKNMGPSYSRNRAISVAKGKWLAIVDADDFISEERLAEMISWGEKYELDIVGDNQIWEDAVSGEFLRNLFPENLIVPPFKLIGIEEYIESVSKVRPEFTYGMVQPIIKAKFIHTNEITYNEKIRFGEDTVLHFDCLMKGGKFGVFQKAMYTVRKRNKKNAKHSKVTVSNQKMVNNYFWNSAISHKKYNLLLLVLKRRVVMIIRMLKQKVGDKLRVL